MRDDANKGRSWWRGAVWMAAGMLIGVALTAGTVYAVMPGVMIVTRESALGFDETVSAIERAIPENGWASPGTMDMNKAMAKHGVEFVPRVKLVQMCKADYAKRVLTTDRYVSCLMPCKAAVWEGDDGKVYVSKMNTGLMGTMFGGTIAEVMGRDVARDEHAIMNGIRAE